MSDIARHIITTLITIVAIFIIFSAPYIAVMAMFVICVALLAFFLWNVINAALIGIQNFVPKRKKNDE